MANPIEIRTTKGDYFDLFDGVEDEFYITRQIHDLHNFQTRNADFTKTLDIPPTPNNIAILDAYEAEASADNYIIPCQIIMGGITVAPKASLIFSGSVTSNTERNYKITILYGNFNLFDGISAGSLADINWADLAYEQTVNEFVNLSQNTTDLVTPIADWVDRQSGAIVQLPFLTNAQTIEINICGFFIYCKEIIKRIMNEAGYSLVLGANMPADYDTIALACPVTKFIEYSDEGQVGISQLVARQGTPFVVDGITTRALWDSGLPSLWDNANDEWDIVDTGNLTISVAGQYSIANGSENLPPSRFVLYRNLNEIVSLDLSQIDVTDIAFYFTITVPVIGGDVIYMEVEAQPGGVNDVVTIETNTEFVIATAGTDISRTIQPSDYIPQLGKSDFLANMLKLFNLVMQTDDITKTVTIEPFDNLFEAPQQDLTKFMDVGLSEIQTVLSIDSLGQTSWMKWQEDNLLRRDVNHSIRFNNQTFNKEKDVIVMEFSACDNSLIHFDSTFDTLLKAKLPGCTRVETRLGTTGPQITISAGAFAKNPFTITEDVSDWTIGDWFVLNISLFVSRYVRITVKIDERTGECDAPLTGEFDVEFPLIAVVKAEPASFEPRLAIMKIDGGAANYTAMNGSQEPLLATAFVANSFSAHWLDSLKMNEITNAYYGKIFNALQAPEVIKAWFNIPIALFDELDFMRPIYLTQLGAFYYLNKINQYKFNSKVQLELIRINKVVPAASAVFDFTVEDISPIINANIIKNEISVNGGTPVGGPGSLPFISSDTVRYEFEIDNNLSGSIRFQILNDPSGTEIVFLQTLQPTVDFFLEIVPINEGAYEGGDIKATVIDN